jgi:hypothetical protein
MKFRIELAATAKADIHGQAQWLREGERNGDASSFLAQVEDHGNPPPSRPPHQLEARRMTAVS